MALSTLCTMPTTINHMMNQATTTVGHYEFWPSIELAYIYLGKEIWIVMRADYVFLQRIMG